MATLLSPSSDQIIVSPRATRASVRRLPDGRLRLEEAPPGFLEALGLSRDLPRDIFSGDPLWPLVAAAREALEQNAPLSDYLIEFAGPRDRSVAVLLEAIPEAADRAIVRLRDVSEIVRERRRAAGIGAYHGLVGQSLTMLEVYHKIAIYGPTHAPVLITGETGTGKELVARALHERSERREKAFVPVNCSALSSELFESEFFGHERGSFTGAVRQHKGRFERADGGTLFLDEVGDMPLMAQAKLLRTLEEGVVERVGSETPLQVDVRIVAATNVALESTVAARRFRADLYHRLSVLRIHLPALRERRGDLPVLAEHYLKFYADRYGRTVRRFSPEALRLLETYPWPGNVRELRNAVERLVVETFSEAVSAHSVARWLEERRALGSVDLALASADAQQHRVFVAMPDGAVVPSNANGPVRYGGEHWGHAALPALPGPAPVERPSIRQMRIPRPELTEETIREAYAANHGNATATADSLGVHKATLYRHMKRLGLTREDLEKAP